MMLARSPAVPPADIIRGVPAIATYLGISRRQVYYLTETNRIPHFRIGRTIHVRKATLLEWIAEQEATGIQIRSLDQKRNEDAREHGR